jgi:hypothetical protein
MTRGSNGKLIKWQVDQMTFLMKWEVDKMASRGNGKLIKE